MNIAINNTLCFNNSEINTLYFNNLELNNPYDLIELLQNDLIKLFQKTKEYTIEKAKDIPDILRIVTIEAYLESYKTRTLYNSLDNIYQFVCDKEQEKAINCEQKIKPIYDFYLDKFKKNAKISEAESKLLSSYRDKIDYIKYIIPRAKQDSLNFFYSVYALNELLNFYFDDYLELAKFLTPPQNIAEFGKNVYIRKQKLI